MPHVLLLSTTSLPHGDYDTPLLATALAARGVDSSIVDWREAADHGADFVLVRSPWDYTQHLDEFLDVLSRIRCTLHNPLAVIRWNSHKKYLVELVAAGITVVPTALARRGDDTLDPGFDGPVVIKPAVSAGAHLTERFGGFDDAARRHFAALTSAGDVLVQPLLDLSQDGERSLMFLGGEYSHTVRKTPRAGDFRVQVNHGGVERNDEPTAQERALADRCLAHVPGGGDLLYARVDVAGPRDAPQLMEIELIEPQLFLDRVHGAADRLADAMVRALT